MRKLVSQRSAIGGVSLSSESDNSKEAYGKPYTSGDVVRYVCVRTRSLSCCMSPLLPGVGRFCTIPVMGLLVMGVGSLQER